MSSEEYRRDVAIMLESLPDTCDLMPKVYGFVFMTNDSKPLHYRAYTTMVMGKIGPEAFMWWISMN